MRRSARILVVNFKTRVALAGDMTGRTGAAAAILPGDAFRHHEGVPAQHVGVLINQ